MYCSKCGMDNLDSAQVCRSCGVQLSPPPVPPGGIVPRTSRLAIAAFVLAVLSPFTCGLTIIPAILSGIISLILVEKSGGRLTGAPFSILAVVGPVFLAAIVVPAFLTEREHDFRMVCGTNLSGIGKAMLIYSNDYDDQLPRSAGKGGQWATTIQDWRGGNRYVAYCLAPDSTGGGGTISSCFYLLVKYVEVKPKSFICRGDSGAKEFDPAADGAGDRTLTELWDFGPEPARHCSYSYHQPFSSYPLSTASEPGLAVAADRNPWMRAPASDGKAAKFARFNPEGDRKTIRFGNAIQHGEDGQNVLFLDNHVNFEKQPFCGVNDDNIFTFWDGSDIRKGTPPVMGKSQPADKRDSLLVHDGH